MSVRFLAQFPTSSWQITTSGGGVLTLPDDDYYLLNSVIADPSLLKALNTLTGFTWAMATDGRVTVNTGAATATWSDTRLRDALGFTGAGLAAGNSTAATASPYRLDLDAAALEDLEEPEALVTRYRTDEAQYTDSWGSRDWRRIRLWVTGHDRVSDADAEYWRARRFWDTALAPGLVLRYYPDSTVSSAFAIGTAPLGYQTYVCDTRTWPLRPVGEGNHNYWRGEILVHPATEL